MEIKPNIFIRDLPNSRREIIAMPDGYRDVAGDWNKMVGMGDRTHFSPEKIDTIEAVLLCYVDNLFLNGKFKTEEGEKAKQQYEAYSGKEWKGGFYYKRSI